MQSFERKAQDYYGEVIINADDDNLSRLKHRLTRPYVTFGFNTDADFRALNLNLEPGRSTFAVYNRGDLLGEVILHVPGKHNVANALAAIAACTELEVPFETIVDGLLHFTGVSRRFEFIGEANDIMVVDDYAHHPTEVKATLDMAREVYNRRVVVLYQPHLFSRTRDFMDDFIDVLSTADIPLLVDIYPAREEPMPGITSEELVRKAHARGFTKFVYAGPRQQCVAEAMKYITKGDLVITMGAGSITLHKHELLEAIKSL